METELIYWRHPTIPGIKVEEVCGGDDKPLKLWLQMAYQIYCENGRDGYREIGHYHNGAPFLAGEDARVSISHSGRFLVIATLPPTPEEDLSRFSPRAAMGVDTETADRGQVLRVRMKFLNDEELHLIPAGDVRQNILAWTLKEALYKAAMTDGLDIREDLRILSLPKIGPAVPVYDKSLFDPITAGQGMLRLPEGEYPMVLYSYESEGRIVSLAYSPKCAKFGKGA